MSGTAPSVADLRGELARARSVLDGARAALRTALGRSGAHRRHPEAGHVIARLHGRLAAADRAGLELLTVDAELARLAPSYQPRADRLPRARRVARVARAAAAVGSRDADLAAVAMDRLDARDEAGFRAGVRALLAAGLLRPAGTVEDEEPVDESQRDSKAARAAEEASSEAASRVAASDAASSRVALGLSVGADVVSAVQSGLADEMSRQASLRAERWSRVAVSAGQHGATADHDGDDIVVLNGQTLAPPGRTTTAPTTAPPPPPDETEPVEPAEADPEPAEADPEPAEADPEPAVPRPTTRTTRRPRATPPAPSPWKNPLVLAAAAVTTLAVAAGAGVVIAHVARRPETDR